MILQQQKQNVLLKIHQRDLNISINRWRLESKWKKKMQVKEIVFDNHKGLIVLLCLLSQKVFFTDAHSCAKEELILQCFTHLSNPNLCSQTQRGQWNCHVNNTLYFFQRRHLAVLYIKGCRAVSMLNLSFIHSHKYFFFCLRTFTFSAEDFQTQSMPECEFYWDA